MPALPEDDPCEAGGGVGLPQIVDSDSYIVRGYGADDRIVCGTGGVVATEDLLAEAGMRLGELRVADVHVRSARNNCFQVRMERG